MHAALPAPSWLSVGDVTKGLCQLSKMAAAGERQRWQEQSRPLWKRPICSPGCAFGNYFRLCDVNTANPVVWFNHTTEPHHHAARASRTFCTCSHHLCTCAPRCPKCNRLSDTRGWGPVQVSRSWKGTSANWKEGLIALESRTQRYSLVAMCKTLKWHVNAPLSGEFDQTWIAMLLMCVD